MRGIELLPAAGVFAVVVLIALAPILFPTGIGLVLVRWPGDPGVAAIDAAASADASLVAFPRPGLVVLHGDAARIRARFGWAIAWRGDPLCS